MRATGYQLDVGKTPGGKQYYHSRKLDVLTLTVPNLPTDGSPV